MCNEYSIYQHRGSCYNFQGVEQLSEMVCEVLSYVFQCVTMGELLMDGFNQQQCDLTNVIM